MFLTLTPTRLELQHLGVGVQSGPRWGSPGTFQFRVAHAPADVAGLLQFKMAVGQHASSVHTETHHRPVWLGVVHATDKMVQDIQGGRKC